MWEISQPQVQHFIAPIFEPNCSHFCIVTVLHHPEIKTHDHHQTVPGLLEEVVDAGHFDPTQCHWAELGGSQFPWIRSNPPQFWIVSGYFTVGTTPDSSVPCLLQIILSSRCLK
ncbi:hypothetical protein AMECASPLE_011649 [Ameca splendens]|uniref:Uncharacterized protein n=1 Tax=Ameca splendens TaxID=208324 RepID=A0ABV0XDX5_9TELE